MTIIVSKGLLKTDWRDHLYRWCSCSLLVIIVAGKNHFRHLHETGPGGPYRHGRLGQGEEGEHNERWLFRCWRLLKGCFSVLALIPGTST